jgi:hypothetical protein
MPADAHPAEVEVLVAVASGEEDILLDETLNRFAQAMEAVPDAEAAFLMVRSEYGADGLVKRLIFEAPAPAALFRRMWHAAQTRLAH